MSVAVVVGNYQGDAVLEDCLASLATQTLPPAEVIVADAGSTDGSHALAERYGARWLSLENRGLGYLYNRGVEATTHPYVLVTNNDVAFDERCLELLVPVLEADPTLFAADPQQLDWSGDAVVHARSTLSRGPLFHELLPGLHLELRAPASTSVPTVTANAGAMLVRRNLHLELGGFDETFFLDVEDLDLCWRAWLRGHGSVYVPEALLRHRVGAAMTAKIRPRRLASSHHNLLRFALKCLPAREAGVVVAGEILRLPRHPLPIARALAAIAREAGEIASLRRSIRPRRDLLRWFLSGQPDGLP